MRGMQGLLTMGDVGTWEVAEQLRSNRKAFEQEERDMETIGWYRILKSGLGIECAVLIV